MALHLQHDSGMRLRGRALTLSHWLFILGLQVTAALSLQSCKNDREGQPASSETDVHDRGQERAVFGTESEGVSSETPKRASPKTSVGLAPDANLLQERARHVDPTTAIPTTKAPAVAEPQISTVRDPGEERVGNRGVPTRAPREPAVKRFLHYQPPGASVGDTGELAQRTPEPQVSVAMKPIRELLQQWADTLLAGDLGAHLSLYPPMLDRFNGSTNVTKGTVRASKQRLISRFAGASRFDMYDVRLRPSREGSVLAEFRIESNAVNSSIIGWYRLEVRQVGGQWKIYGEDKVQPVSRRSGL